MSFKITRLSYNWDTNEATVRIVMDDHAIDRTVRTLDLSRESAESIAARVAEMARRQRIKLTKPKGRLAKLVDRHTKSRTDPDTLVRDPVDDGTRTR